MRDDDEDKEADTMDKWDEDKLKEVVEKKHGAATAAAVANRTTTDIVIHLFIFYCPCFLTYLTAIIYSRYASTFWKLWNGPSTVGFGNVHRVKDVFTDMHCHQDLS